MLWSLVLAWVCTGIDAGAHHVQAHYDVLVTMVGGLTRVTTLRERESEEGEGERPYKWDPLPHVGRVSENHLQT